MLYLLMLAAVILAAFKAAWDIYSHEVFAMVCVCAAIGATATGKAMQMSAEAKATRTQVDEGGGYGCLFWIAWKIGGVALILLLGAFIDQWF